MKRFWIYRGFNSLSLFEGGLISFAGRITIRAVLTVVVLLGLMTASEAAPISIFNTGVDDNNKLLPNGSVDPHYTLGGGGAFVVNNGSFPLDGNWLADGPNSDWVGPSPSGFGPGSTYRTTFDLTGFDPNSAQLSGAWATDNEGMEILVNGQPTGNIINPPDGVGFRSLHSFTISRGFVSGVNTLDFIVHNDGGPTGLRVEVSGTAAPGTAGPPPISTACQVAVPISGIPPAPGIPPIPGIPPVPAPTGTQSGQVVILPDSDCDGLPDSWEEFGYDRNGVHVDLPAMGADKNHKDIFVQVDYMVADTHTHRPLPEALQDLITAFAQAPVNNPDGRIGIHLHIDAGPDSVMNPVTGDTWGSFSSAQALTHQDELGFTTSDGYQWTEFDLFKTQSLDEARLPIFHYAIFAHNLGGLDGVSGISRGIGSSDFIVSLGSWTNLVGTEKEQAGTLMHELGHNLGLGHGGGDDVNYKPNYLSVMNYSFQTRGLRKLDPDGKHLDGHFDYSEFSPPILDKTALNEPVGLSGGSATNDYGTKWYCSDKTPMITNFVNEPIDWDCDGAATGNAIFANINNGPGNVPSPIVQLTSQNDWAVLKYNGGAIGNGAATFSDAPMTSQAVDELDVETDKSIATPERAGDTTAPTTIASANPIPNVNGWNNVNVTVTLSATDNSGGSGVRSITYSLTGAQTGGSTVNNSTTFFPISAEGITTVTYNAVDNAGNAEVSKTLLVRIDKTPPTITGLPTPGPNAFGWNNTDVAVNFSCSDALSGIDTCGPSPQIVSDEGLGQSRTATAVDRAGNAALSTVSGIKIDKTPPAIAGIPAPGCTLWPPNHELRTVGTVSASDTLSGLAPGAPSVAGNSNEPELGSGSGDTTPDIVITGGTVQLRAERSGSGTGRLYTVTAIANDRAGNSATATGTCTVPHDQSQ